MILAINIILAAFWFIIASIHVYLIVKHFRWSKENIEHMPKIAGIAGKINSVSTGVIETREAINKFIDKLNQHNQAMNWAQMKGYITALVASLIGLTLSISGIFIGGA